MPDAPGQKTVLLVEDDRMVRRDVALALTARGFRVLESDLGKVGWDLFLSKRPDLAILDLTLPDVGGIALCEKIRGHKELGRTPVIILTGRSQPDDKVSGFKAGADQYLVKPVAPTELALWAEALLRRVALDAGETDILRVGELELDNNSRGVRFRDEEVPYLTAKEFDLLYFLVKKRPQVLSRKFLLSQLWHTITVDQVVNTHISNLRRKLPPELADHIQTVPGKGFRFME